MSSINNKFISKNLPRANGSSKNINLNFLCAEKMFFSMGQTERAPGILVINLSLRMTNREGDKYAGRSNNPKFIELIDGASGRD